MRVSATVLLLAVCGAVALGCSTRRARPPARPRVERQRLTVQGANGLSDLAFDDQGRAWMVAERDRVLVVVDRSGAARTMPLEGVPEGADTESIAWLGGSRFAVGTETQEEGRDADVILTVQVEGDVARVVGQTSLAYGPLGIPAEANHGIEGVCVVGDVVLAAIEVVVEQGGQRWATVARGALGSSAWVPFRVLLTSATGTLSGLACRRAGSSIEVLAIERMYAVSRLVSLRVPLRRSGRRVRARLRVDLAGRFEGDPNIEGVAPRGDHTVLLVDNQSGSILTGPNEMLRVFWKW